MTLGGICNPWMQRKEGVQPDEPHTVVIITIVTIFVVIVTIVSVLVTIVIDWHL